MNRIGQVWDLDGSIELIVAREREDRYLTLVLWCDHHQQQHDRVSEGSLKQAERDHLMTKYQRIA